MTREPEWDDHTRAQALALVADEGMRCHQCGHVDTVVPIRSDTRHVTWPNGDKYEVSQYRCLACGAREIVERDWAEKHKNDTVVTGRFMEADGRQTHVQRIARGGEIRGGNQV